MTQLTFPWAPLPHPKITKIHHHPLVIPRPAALTIFHETFNHYLALREIECLSSQNTAFCLDVLDQFHRLYGDSTPMIIAKLSDDETKCVTTRIALGTLFLQLELWPVKAYFSS